MRNAKITGIATYFPEHILTNEYLSGIVDTSDEWIMTRVGIKERRQLTIPNEGTSYMGIQAVNKLLEKTQIPADKIDVIIFATTTPDYMFPSTAALTAQACGITDALGFDIEAACSGFLYALELGTNFIKTGKKKVIVVAGDNMTSITNYNDRATCPLFGDAAGAVMLEPSFDETGIIDSILHVDGIGYPYLHMKGGGSAYPASDNTVKEQMHYVYQEGQVVFKHAVTKMVSACEEIMNKNSLTLENLDWLVPHQANIRIIEAVGNKLEVPLEKVMINIQKYGNTSAATIPLCLNEWESSLKKGDNIILTAFGAGFTWGATYLKWAY